MRRQTVASWTGPSSGDEAEPLGDEHYPDNDEYEDVDDDGDEATGEEAV